MMSTRPSGRFVFGNGAAGPSFDAPPAAADDDVGSRQLRLGRLDAGCSAKALFSSRCFEVHSLPILITGHHEFVSLGR